MTKERDAANEEIELKSVQLVTKNKEIYKLKDDVRNSSQSNQNLQCQLGVAAKNAKDLNNQLNYTQEELNTKICDL